MKLYEKHSSSQFFVSLRLRDPSHQKEGKKLKDEVPDVEKFDDRAAKVPFEVP